MSINEEKLRKQFPKITSITKHKITNKKHDTIQQEIVLHLPDKKEYQIKLTLTNNNYCAMLANYVILNQFRFPMQVNSTDFNTAISRLISERYHNTYG